MPRLGLCAFPRGAIEGFLSKNGRPIFVCMLVFLKGDWEGRGMEFGGWLLQ